MRYGTHLALNCSKSSFLIFHLTCRLETWPLHIRGSIIHLQHHVTRAPHMLPTFSSWSIWAFTLGDLDVLFSTDWRAEQQDKNEKWRRPRDDVGVFCPRYLQLSAGIWNVGHEGAAWWPSLLFLRNHSISMELFLELCGGLCFLLFRVFWHLPARLCGGVCVFLCTNRWKKKNHKIMFVRFFFFSSLLCPPSRGPPCSFTFWLFLQLLFSQQQQKTNAEFCHKWTCKRIIAQKLPDLESSCKYFKEKQMFEKWQTAKWNT